MLNEAKYILKLKLLTKTPSFFYFLIKVNTKSADILGFYNKNWGQVGLSPISC